MANINAILNQRVKKSDGTSKMAAMAQQSATGNLTSFAGIFSVTELSEKEKDIITTILKDHTQNIESLEDDLQVLLSITSEVKAINNQAAILHGERIKKAHTILTHYQEGAFTAWLIAAYGNRQTPYNLMQYYEFYEALPKNLRPQLEMIPRQAVYALASRNGSLEKKQALVKNYQGETKAQLLTLIRETFPLNQKDKRGEKVGENLIQILQKVYKQCQESQPKLRGNQRQKIQRLLQQLQKLIGEK